MNDRAERRTLLSAAGNNLALLPDELIVQDYLSDSLFRKNLPAGPLPLQTGLPVYFELCRTISELFGFPHCIPTAQGRTAEAILFKALSRNGCGIPANFLFPTTRIHAQINGAVIEDVGVDEALNCASLEPFRGNIDLDKLAAAVDRWHARWIPCIAIELCNNAAGGQPVSLANLRAVREFAEPRGIPIYLDACRILENAVLIAEREAPERNVWDIAREICSLADCCTFSASKDLPLGAGGCIALRSEALYAECFDISLALGGGLDFGGAAAFLAVLREPERIAAGVRRKMALVRRLHNALAEACPLLRPAGGHAVFIDASACAFSLPAELHPLESFLFHLFLEHGVRGGIHPPTPAQQAAGIRLLRFAVPLTQEEQKVDEAAAAISAALQTAEAFSGLQKISQPPGLSGGMRAVYQPIEESRSGE